MPEVLLTAPEIVITWQDGELMADNFWTRRCIEISKDVMLILHHCASGITHDDLSKALQADGFDITEEDLAAAELDLLQAGLLLDTAAGEQQASLIGQNPSWSYWGPEAQYFHFATKDAPYVVKATKESVDYYDEMVNSPQPPLIKRYAMADRLPLPRVRSDLPQKFSEVLLARRTVRDFTDAPVGVEQLSVLCDLAFAPQQFVNADPFGALPLRTYANAGARSELEVYVNAIKVEGVDPGLYHYNGIEHSLELIGDVLSCADMGYLSYEQDMCSAAAVSFFVTARVDRVGHKYRNPRALRAIYADGGHLAQAFGMIATACGLGAWQTLAFRDTEIEEKLGIDGVVETVIYLLGTGIPVPESAHTPISLNDVKRTNFYEDVDLPPSV